MRVALIAIGSTGDTQPMALLGKELMKHGHQAQLFAFSALEPLAIRAGLPFQALPGDAARFIGGIMRPGASPFTYFKRMHESLDGTIEPLLDEIYKAFQGADAVVCTFFGATPYAMAEKTGTVFFQVNFSPIDPTGQYGIPVMRTLPLGHSFNQALYRLAYRMIGAVERRYAHPWCAQKGVVKRPGGSKPDYRIGERRVPVLYAFSEHVVPRAPEWSEAVHEIGFFFEDSHGFAPSAALSSFLDRKPAPIYIGFGSMPSCDEQKTLCALLDALVKTKLRAILAPGWSDMCSAEFPSHIHCEDKFVPHDWLFPKVQAVVHHGGAGTTASGLRAGVPTLIVPHGGDQFFWGERVYSLGCGPKPLPFLKLTGSSLANRLEKLVSNASYRRNAVRMGALLREESGILRAVKMIEQELNDTKLH